MAGWLLGRRRLSYEVAIPLWVEVIIGTVAATLAALAVLTLAVLAVRHLRAGDGGSGPGHRPRPPATPSRPADPLQAARAAAARGEVAAALSHLYAAALESLARQGYLRLRPSATGRAYLRELRQTAPDLAPAFAALTEFCEARWYAGTPAAPGDFQAALGLASPLLGKEVAP